MGLFKRIHRITIGRIEALLDRVEDPEIVFPQLVREMEGQLRAATEAEARASASLKAAQRQVQTHGARIERLGRGAALALERGEEDTARRALEAQIDSEQAAGRAEANLACARNTLAHATVARKQIQGQLAELRTRKDEILTRARVAKARRKIQQTVSGSASSTGSILDAVARLEAAVEQAEAETEIRSDLAGQGPSASLEARLAELARSAQVEKRLAQLRDRLPRPVAPQLSGVQA